jgi:hypothetical protein
MKKINNQKFILVVILKELELEKIGMQIMSWQ